MEDCSGDAFESVEGESVELQLAFEIENSALFYIFAVENGLQKNGHDAFSANSCNRYGHSLFVVESVTRKLICHANYSFCRRVATNDALCTNTMKTLYVSFQ